MVAGKPERVGVSPGRMHPYALAAPTCLTLQTPVRGTFLETRILDVFLVESVHSYFRSGAELSLGHSRVSPLAFAEKQVQMQCTGFLNSCPEPRNQAVSKPVLGLGQVLRRVVRESRVQEWGSEPGGFQGLLASWATL